MELVHFGFNLHHQIEAMRRGAWVSSILDSGCIQSRESETRLPPSAVKNTKLTESETIVPTKRGLCNELCKTQNVNMIWRWHLLEAESISNIMDANLRRKKWTHLFGVPLRAEWMINWIPKVAHPAASFAIQKNPPPPQRIPIVWIHPGIPPFNQGNLSMPQIKGDKFQELKQHFPQARRERERGKKNRKLDTVDHKSQMSETEKNFVKPPPLPPLAH